MSGGLSGSPVYATTRYWEECWNALKSFLKKNGSQKLTGDRVYLEMLRIEREKSK